MKLMLVLLASALAVLLYLQWGPLAVSLPAMSVAAPAVPAADNANDGAKAAFSIPLGDIVDYAGIIERPLFLLGRRPAPKEPEPVRPATVAKPLKGLDLAAIMITPRRSVALVRDAATGENERLSSGDKIRGWTVKSVEKGRLRLVSGSKTGVLELREFPEHAAPRPKAGKKANARPRARTKRRSLRSRKGRDSDED